MPTLSDETPIKEQFQIVLALGGAIIVLILLVAGSDVYISRYDFPRWLEMIFNILSFLFAIYAAVAFFKQNIPTKNENP